MEETKKQPKKQKAKKRKQTALLTTIDDGPMLADVTKTKVNSQMSKIRRHQATLIHLTLLLKPSIGPNPRLSSTLTSMGVL